MSATRQAIRARRKARLDPRYIKYTRRDAAARQRKLARMIETERRIKSKGKS